MNLSGLLLGFDNLIQSLLLHHYEQPWHLDHLRNRLVSDISSYFMDRDRGVARYTDEILVEWGRTRGEDRHTTSYSSKKLEFVGKRIVRFGVGSLYIWEKKRLHCGKGVCEPVISFFLYFSLLLPLHHQSRTTSEVETHITNWMIRMGLASLFMYV